jgi:UDP-N-acetylmuramoyl-L-alanyl-D-glutamate--2,6-diaminopimelate ligase
MQILFRKLKKIYWTLKSFLVRYYYGNPARKLKIVGVTGTSGKTTNVTLLYRITRELGLKAGLISTVENLINDEKVSIDDGSDRPGTTPDVIYLNKIFKKMVEAKCEYVFMEVSSHSADQKRVAGIPFVGGIFVNLSQDHLDYHKSMEEYFQAKKKFFKMLPPRAFALSNADDKYGFRILENIKANPFVYGFNQDFEKVHFYGEIKKVDFSGLELSFNKIDIKSKLLGKFNAYNLLSVWSACSLLGLDMQKVNKIIENINPPKGRFEHFTSSSGVLVVVDYAHKPDALEKIFEAVKEVLSNEGKLISVFGCGGDRDTTKRPIMGKIGVDFSDIAIFTSDNPRSEDPDKIIEDMKKNLSIEELKKVKTMPDRREAILESVRLAQSGDIILCAGKGHEDYQIIKGVKSHFDDIEEYKKAYAN